MATCLYCKGSSEKFVLDALGRCPACRKASIIRRKRTAWAEPLGGVAETWHNPTGYRSRPVGEDYQEEE